MANTVPGSEEWLASVQEEILDPDRPIIDPHHHLWNRGGSTYLLDQLRSDTNSGHNIVKTVFLECRANYREYGPDHLKCVGETEFVEPIAAASRDGKGAEIAAIVPHADLRSPHLDEILDAHEVAAKGLFRGIRHAGARDPHPEHLSIPGRASEGLYEDEDYRAGLARLGDRGLTFDTWHYHHQNASFRDLAEAVPGTTMVLDHFGTPLGVGVYDGKREEIWATWVDDIQAIAERPNVVAKLGGLAMPDNGFRWNTHAQPPISHDFVQEQARYYHHAIECFGPERCMFESNFPVDRASISYPILWNALKKIAAPFNEADHHAMFYGTAERVYRI